MHDDEPDSKITFGFWLYLMTDLLMFAALFATYAVLHNNTFGGPSGQQLFNMPYVLLETMILLTSSFTCGLAMLATHLKNKKMTLVWLVITFILGLSFLGLELTEFNHLISEGNNWQKSAFLSSYFTLVGTHGLHITIGLVWLAICTGVIWKHGLTSSITRKLTLFSLFWHFLDLVWIFIFTIVYLMGVM